MNHDATHCADYKKDCPKTCYRAELTADLLKTHYPLPTSWANFEGTDECPKCQKTEVRQMEAQFNEMIKDVYSVLRNDNMSRVLVSALYAEGWRKQSELTPCDVCRFNPPSSGDGKPCSICPAQAKGE